LGWLASMIMRTDAQQGMSLTALSHRAMPEVDVYDFLESMTAAH
jgi:hypothetical protein